MRSTRLKPISSVSPSPRAARTKTELLRTLQVICRNLRALQKSPETVAIYREVEQFLTVEIARLGRPRRR